MANLAAFKYKRHCSIFQTDLQKDNDDKLLVQSPTKSIKNVVVNCNENRDNSLTLNHNSMDPASNLETVNKSESSSNNGTIFDKNALENDMSTSFRLNILKGIFKDAYSEDDVVNAVGNTDSLEQAVSILLESPIKSDKKDGMVKPGMVPLVLPSKTTANKNKVKTATMILEVST